MLCTHGMSACSSALLGFLLWLCALSRHRLLTMVGSRALLSALLGSTLSCTNLGLPRRGQQMMTRHSNSPAPRYPLGSPLYAPLTACMVLLKLRVIDEISSPSVCAPQAALGLLSVVLLVLWFYLARLPVGCLPYAARSAASLLLFHEFLLDLPRLLLQKRALPLRTLFHSNEPGQKLSWRFRCVMPECVGCIPLLIALFNGRPADVSCASPPHTPPTKPRLSMPPPLRTTAVAAQAPVKDKKFEFPVIPLFPCPLPKLVDNQLAFKDVSSEWLSLPPLLPAACELPSTVQKSSVDSDSLELSSLIASITESIQAESRSTFSNTLDRISHSCCSLLPVSSSLAVCAGTALSSCGDCCILASPSQHVAREKGFSVQGLFASFPIDGGSPPKQVISSDA